MDNILLISSFVATGAAWGMAWSGGFGILKKDMCSVTLLKIVSLVFVLAGSLYGSYIIYDLYGKYSSGTVEEKELFKNYFAGKNLITNGGRLIIQLSPLILVIPILRKSKLVCAIVGTCYVLLPFYSHILAKVAQ